jgi:hypothetical protein
MGCCRESAGRDERGDGELTQSMNGALCVNARLIGTLVSKDTWFEWPRGACSGAKSDGGRGSSRTA